jgi:hypothetical protein
MGILTRTPGFESVTCVVFYYCVRSDVPDKRNRFCFCDGQEPTGSGAVGSIVYVAPGVGHGQPLESRVVYIWDEFLGGTTQWSAWISHAVGIVCLTAMGCMSCIVAPASTMDVDTVPHPDCADEPLFQMLPISVDDLYLLGIGHQPQTIDVSTLPKDSLKDKQQYIRMSILQYVDKIPDKTEANGDSEANEDSEENEDIEANKEGPPEDSQELEASMAWSSGGTGRRPSYSSVRAPSEDGRRSSYFELQRPDLDHRVSLTESVTSLGSSGIAPRRRSSLNRSR